MSGKDCRERTYATLTICQYNNEVYSGILLLCDRPFNSASQIFIDENSSSVLCFAINNTKNCIV